MSQLCVEDADACLSCSSAGFETPAHVSLWIAGPKSSFDATTLFLIFALELAEGLGECVAGATLVDDHRADCVPPLEDGAQVFETASVGMGDTPTKVVRAVGAPGCSAATALAADVFPLCLDCARRVAMAGVASLHAPLHELEFPLIPERTAHTGPLVCVEIHSPQRMFVAALEALVELLVDGDFAENFGASP